MSIEHPQIKSGSKVGHFALHQMIQEQCEAYFIEIESEAGQEEPCEEALAEIGQMVLMVYYQEDFDRFVRQLKENAEAEAKNEEE